MIRAHENGERLPTLSEVRLAFLAAQQALRRLQRYPQQLLNVATFRYVDDGGHADIDKALDLLEREVAVLRAARQNHLALRATPTEAS